MKLVFEEKGTVPNYSVRDIRRNGVMGTIAMNTQLAGSRKMGPFAGLVLLVGVIVSFQAHAQSSDNDARTVETCRALANRDDTAGERCLGLAYFAGKGAPQDYKMAAHWFGMAASHGDAMSQFSLGLIYHEGYGVPQDRTLAIKWIRAAAEQGFVFAQRNMGDFYANGDGVSQDYKLAALWYGKAAGQGDALAQKGLGQLYENGQGVSQDYKLAMKWYWKSAHQGYARAFDNLGVLYSRGEGEPKDLVVGYALFDIAATLEPSLGEAVDNRKLVAAELSADQIKEAQRFAERLLRIEADNAPEKQEK